METKNKFKILFSLIVLVLVLFTAGCSKVSPDSDMIIETDDNEVVNNESDEVTKIIEDELITEDVEIGELI